MNVRLLKLAISFPLLAASGGAATPESLPALLEHTGKQVERFWDELSSVSCLESVVQLKLDPGLKVVSQKRALYSYLILLQLSGDQLTVEESRELQGKGPKESAQPLLMTGGFSVFMLVFHPHFQSSFVFSELPSSQPGVRKLAFSAVRGARSPSVIELRGRDYPIEWSGVATLDAASGVVTRIQAGLSAPMEDIGLLELKADVSYAPVSFRNPPAQHWLPTSALIEAATRKQRWRNTHEFSGYRKFSVNTDVQIGAPK